MTRGTVFSRALLPATAVIALAFPVGCGGGSGSTASSADFVAQGNQICKEDNAKFKALGAPSGSDLRPFLEKVIPVLDEDLSRLKGLTPPSDQADTYNAWIADLEKGTELTKKAQAAPSADAATQILQGSLAINKQADAKAKQLGLDQCLTGSGSGSS
jgi:hypothetical protein